MNDTNRTKITIQLSSDFIWDTDAESTQMVGRMMDRELGAHQVGCRVVDSELTLSGPTSEVERCVDFFQAH